MRLGVLNASAAQDRGVSPAELEEEYGRGDPLAPEPADAARSADGVDPGPMIDNTPAALALGLFMWERGLDRSTAIAQDLDNIARASAEAAPLELNPTQQVIITL